MSLSSNPREQQIILASDRGGVFRAGLTLPGKLSRVGWELPKGMAYEQWEVCGAALHEIEGSVQWWLGDWWAYGEESKEYGKRIKAIEEGPLKGMNFGTLATYGWVARSVESSRRLELLSFQHHWNVAALSPEQQREWLARALEGDGDGNRWSSNELKAAIARQAAIERTQAVELDAERLGKFVVLYADPPWRYENPPMGGSNRSIENHYPTMELTEICAVPVSEIAHENSVLFMWATSPKLAECFEVIKAWDFNYRTDMVWIKDKIGMGYHVRERHEGLLIAKRGELPPPPVEARPASVVEAPRREHSAKPPIFYDLIDQMYPNVRKIELFGRAPEARPNWWTWGNQAQPREAAE
jgi:N6-adenosine-specific RNA methylase IME4